VACPGNGTTSITGTVTDPAGKNPLYDIIAYIPATPLGTLPAGVPTGADACSCSALFQGNPVVFAATDVNGKFTIKNAPVGRNIPLVIQIGKWRKQLTVNTTACQATDAGSIHLPKNSGEGDLPDIAVSTGAADSLECLLVRVGIDPAEFVPGWTQPGHVHIFNGGGPPSGGGEGNPMPNAPASTASLWDSTADLMKNDLVLLSCEGAETAGAIPQNLEDYLNAGGRAFASHYHYSWFTGFSWLNPSYSYSAPSDWGSNLASWYVPPATLGPGLGVGSGPVGGTIVTTLTAGGTFYKGQALDQWLGNVSALGLNGAPADEVSVAVPRFNASVTNQTVSQSWIQLDTATDPQASQDNGSQYPTLYFSFDTPLNPTTTGHYCGRAVYSDLHVGGSSYDGVNCLPSLGLNPGVCNANHVAAAPPPTGCDSAHDLSPEEKVLEFMLFDLSSCVIPDTVAPTNDAGVPVLQ
jgi:hypothetical protein